MQEIRAGLHPMKYPHAVIFQSILLLVVSLADHDEQLPQTNECFVSPPALPTIIQGHSLALNQSSLAPAPADSGLSAPSHHQ